MKVAKQQVTLVDHMGCDLSVVNAARVSFDKESEWEFNGISKMADGSPIIIAGKNKKRLSEKDSKLIKYLAKHNHKSPFNHCFATFRVKAPIFVARQLVKHEYMPWNEVSRRYVDDEPEFFFPKTWRKRAENVKQGSSDEAITGYNDPYDCYHDFSEIANMAVERCFDVYEMLLEGGVAPEQARMVLPQNTMTEWIWSGSLFAIAKMCKLRLDSHAQKEAQEVAQLIASEMTNLYPVSWQALMEN